MEDYREIGPPGNGETRKTGASNLAAVRETTRHVRIHASRVIFRGALKGVVAIEKHLPFVHNPQPEGITSGLEGLSKNMSITNFADIIAPVSEDVFFADYHGKKPLHVNGNADKFAGVMSWETLNGILDMTDIWSAATMGLHLGGEAVPPAEFCRPGADRNNVQVQIPMPEKVQALLARGATLMCNNIARLTPELSATAGAIEEAIECRVQANLYCSWLAQQAFHTHYDTHDVFAVHVEGEKTWRVYEGRLDNPINHPRFKGLDQTYHDKARGRVLMEVTLTPGDLLYIPRGQYHDALAASQGTIHVPFGATSMIGMDLISEAFERAVEAPEFRASLPRLHAEGGKKAWDAHVNGLAGRLAEIVRSPDFRRHMKDVQRNYSQARGRFDLPGAIANPEYRRITDGLQIVRKRDAWFLANETDAVEIPRGGNAMVAWMLEQDKFSREQFDEAFAKKPDLFKKELLDALIAMKVLSIL